MFEIGQQVGPYIIVAQVGKGGMATVYKARQEALNRFVAIKVLHVAFKDDNTFQERFRREAQIIGRLDHPNIVPIHDYADDGMNPYLVLKYIDGETLKDRMHRAPSITLDETITVMTAVASALDFAHRQGILHRDVKPSNIMLDKADQRPYLTDFGLARIASLGESTLSRDMMLGTPQYISPEQAQGNRELDARTDIYSLAIVLYELVVGRVPFTGDTPYAIIHNHIYTPLPLPSEVNPTVPQAVQEVLIRALAKDPKDRYSSAGEMIAAFQVAIQKSQLKELSAASYRPEVFMSHMERSFHQAIGGAVSAPTGSTPSAIPAPGSGYWVTPPSGTLPGQVARPKNWFQNNTWLMTGCLMFVLVCLAMFGVMSGAGRIAESRVVDPGTRPASELEATALGNAGPGPNVFVTPPFGGGGPNGEFIIRQTIAEHGINSVAEAEQYLSENPNQPEAYFVLAVMEIKDKNMREALNAIARAGEKGEIPASLVLEMADLFAESKHPDRAVWLYIEALDKYPDDKMVREIAGAKLYEYATEGTVRNTQIFCGQVSNYAPDSMLHSVLKALIAQSMMSAGIPDLEDHRALLCPEEIKSQGLSELLSIGDETLVPEIRLIQATYYFSVKGEVSMANEIWTSLIEGPEIPQWVREAARDNRNSQQ